MWLKAAAPGTAFEAALYELLARSCPIGCCTRSRPTRAGLDRASRRRSAARRAPRAPSWSRRSSTPSSRTGELQRELAPTSDELLALGVPDMRPAAMPERFDEALAATAGTRTTPSRRRRRWPWAHHRRGASSWRRRGCRRASTTTTSTPGTSSATGDDVEVLRLGRQRRRPPVRRRARAARLRAGRSTRPSRTPFRRARDAYLEVFADLRRDEDLVETLELACRVAKIARALTWDRAIQAARSRASRSTTNGRPHLLRRSHRSSTSRTSAAAERPHGRGRTRRLRPTTATVRRHDARWARTGADDRVVGVAHPGRRVRDPLHARRRGPTRICRRTSMPSWVAAGQHAAVWFESRLPSPKTTQSRPTRRIGCTTWACWPTTAVITRERASRLASAVWNASGRVPVLGAPVQVDDHDPRAGAARPPSVAQDPPGAGEVDRPGMR